MQVIPYLSFLVTFLLSLSNKGKNASKVHQIQLPSCLMMPMSLLTPQSVTENKKLFLEIMYFQGVFQHHVKKIAHIKVCRQVVSEINPHRRTRRSSTHCNGWLLSVICTMSQLSEPHSGYWPS